MYQLLIRLRVERDCAWERRYHRKVRGRLAQALADTPADHAYGTDAAPFTFSEPMPAGDRHPGDDLSAGDELHLLVAAGDLGVLRAIAADLKDRPELTAGSVVTSVRAARPIQTGVGPVGATGQLTTASGIIMTMPTDRPTPTYWTDRDHDTEAFVERLPETLTGVFEHEAGVEPPEGPLFDDYDYRKTFGVKLEVVPGETITVLASKWDFDYEVRDDQHRRALNAVLAHGIGGKRSYGFGMLQTRSDAGILDATADAAAEVT